MMERHALPRVVLAHLALAASGVLLGLGSVVSKLGLAGMNPVLFGLLREVCAAPLLLLISVVLEGDAAGSPRRGWIPPRRDWLEFFIAGGCLFLTNFLYIIGVKLLGATPAAIWQSATPVFTMIIAVAVGLERFTPLKLCGVGFAFVGCAFVALYRPASGAADADAGAAHPFGRVGVWTQLQGHLIFLLQVTGFSGFLVAEKPLLRKWSPLATLAYSYFVASSLMLAAALLVNTSPTLLGFVCPECAPACNSPPPRTRTPARPLLAPAPDDPCSTARPLCAAATATDGRCPPRRCSPSATGSSSSLSARTSC